MMSCMISNVTIDGIPHKQIIITFPANGEVNVQEYTDMMFNAMAGGLAIDGDGASVDVANAITELDNSGRRELLNELFSTLVPEEEEPVYGFDDYEECLPPEAIVGPDEEE